MIGFKMHDPETRLPWHDKWWNPECAVSAAHRILSGVCLAFQERFAAAAEFVRS